MKSAMNIQKILASISLLGMVVSPAYAIDTWSTTKGVLNMPLVQYGSKTYQNVTAVLGGVISVGSTCSSTSTAADTLSSSTGQLSIPAVTVTTGTGPVTYCNAQVWLSSITSVGGVCANASSCAQYFTPVSYASNLPRSYAPSLTVASNPLPSSVSLTTNRLRYLIGDSNPVSTATNFLSIGGVITTGTATTAGFAAASSTIPLSSTYKTYLSKLIQVVAVSDNGTNATVYETATSGYAFTGYRLDSHLHPLESIDVDAADSLKLKFRRHQGSNIGTNPLPAYGYVAFTYDTTNHTLRAAKRYLRTAITDTTQSGCSVSKPCYNSTWTIDTAFIGAGYYVNYSGGVFSLVQNSASATPLYFFSSADKYGVPSSMNPTATNYTQTNTAASFPSNGTLDPYAYVQSQEATGSGGLASKLLSTHPYYQQYLNQVSASGLSSVSTPGANVSTKAAADSFLTTIQNSLANDPTPGHLRYAADVYTAFRDGALSRFMASDAAADGQVYQHLVPYVYFTNEVGPDNNHHPFMVVVTYTNSEGPTGLLDIPVPPGAGSAGSTGPMTRYTNLTSQSIRIPMKDYGIVTDVATGGTTCGSTPCTKNTNACPSGTSCNLLSASSGSKWFVSLNTDNSSSATYCYNRVCPPSDVYNYASTADNGILIDGSFIFPNLNNTLNPSQWKAELSVYGCHVGQGGGGHHCHADGFQSGQSNLLAIYNDQDYVGRTHPPLIGFGYDGVALFGKYRGAQDSTMLGYNVPLDKFGGHNHDGIGYHYHSETVDMADPGAGTSSPNYSVNTYTYSANGKNICSGLSPSCSGGSNLPTKVNNLLRGAWAGDINSVPSFMDNSGANTYLGR